MTTTKLDLSWKSHPDTCVCQACTAHMACRCGHARADHLDDTGACSVRRRCTCRMFVLATSESQPDVVYTRYHGLSEDGSVASEQKKLLENWAQAVEQHKKKKKEHEE